MIRLRPQYWLFGLLLALAAHLSAFVYTTMLPASEPVWRGGGLSDNGTGRFGDGNGVVVHLGPAQPGAATPPAPKPKAQPEAKAEASPKPPAPKPEVPKPEAKTKATPVAKAETKPVPEPAPAPPPAEAATPKTPTAAVPLPKPARPSPPAASTKTARATPPPAPATPPAAKPAPPPAVRDAEKEKEKAEAVARQKAATRVTASVNFGRGAARHGTASGNREGADRKLTYGDRVMLWLQAHGAYPFQAARYHLDDTVTVEFAINRRGQILYYKLVKESRWYLLNTAVRQMMERSSPVPPFPPEITDNELTFTVPVHFAPP